MDTAHKEPNYMGVFYWLFALTVIEVVIGMTHFLPRVLYIALLISLAGVKAALVAAYFMHLKFERRTMTYIAIFPVVLLVIGQVHHGHAAPSELLLDSVASGQEGAGTSEHLLHLP